MPEFYTIGTLARQVGVNVETVRYYQRRGLIGEPRRPPGGIRRWESLFITTLIPIFALLALAANALGWRSHRQTRRLVLGVIGPLLVLSAALLMRFAHIGTAPLLYVGLAFMLAVSVWDLVSPPVRRCTAPTCQPSANG